MGPVRPLPILPECSSFSHCFEMHPGFSPIKGRKVLLNPEPSRRHHYTRKPKGENGIADGEETGKVPNLATEGPSSGKKDGIREMEDIGKGRGEGEGWEKERDEEKVEKQAEKEMAKGGIRPDGDLIGREKRYWKEISGKIGKKVKMGRNGGKRGI